MKHDVKLTAEASKDYERLDNHQKLHVNKSFAKIERDGMLVGEALHGNLAGCRKLKHLELGLRIVFREVNSEVEIIEVIVIGKRSDSEVHKEAEKRLKLN